MSGTRSEASTPIRVRLRRIGGQDAFEIASIQVVVPEVRTGLYCGKRDDKIRLEIRVRFVGVATRVADH